MRRKVHRGAANRSRRAAFPRRRRWMAAKARAISGLFGLARCRKKSHPIAARAPTRAAWPAKHARTCDGVIEAPVGAAVTTGHRGPTLLVVHLDGRYMLQHAVTVRQQQFDARSASCCENTT